MDQFDYSRASSGSSASSDMSSMRMKRWMINLHKNVAGREPDDRAMDKINQFAQHNVPLDKQNIANETRYMERLKLHLIKQDKHKEAKRVVELYQKLKGMSVVKNRESVITLMYQLFDKEATRAAMASGKTGQGHVSGRGRELVGGVVVDKQEKLSPITATPAGPRAAKDLEYMDQDPTPIPRLKCPSDNLLSKELVNSTKVPSLSRPVGLQQHQHITSRQPDSMRWDSLNQMDSMQRNGPNSISKISKGSDDFSCNVPSLYSSSTIVGSTPNIFASTPMDAAKQKQLNFRKFQDPHHSVSSRQNKVITTGTSQTFTNVKSMEKDLIRDIVFILQGIDGTHIKSTPKGTFDIVTKQYVHPSLRLQTLKLCEMGYCYSKIRNYSESPTSGLMAQGFKQAIEKELQEYYRLLAVIQGQVQQIVVDTPISEDFPRKRQGDMTMLKLGIWMFDCRPRLLVLAGMVDGCGSRRGGDLCSIIHKYSQHGDPLVSELTVSLLSIVCKPLYIMLSQWILYGELEDPFNEFFIAQDLACKREQLWHQKYRIRSEMLPSFISMKQAEKILAIGKNINFLKDICNNWEGFEGKKEIKMLLETGEVESLFMDENSPIQYAIEMSYKNTSEKVLKVLIEDSNLLHHLKAIKKYLLLGQGDFIQYFLELIQDELSKPASKLYNHDISAILESAVRATNAQFESEDVLSRLDTRILPTSDKDLGWDVFCLDYKVHGPIGTVLTEDIMNGYNKLFNSLWRTKRIEIILSTLWKNQTVLFKYLRLIPELAPVLHRSQLLISEMIHFVHQTQYYIMFEATEVAWERLMEEVNKSSDLDEVIKSHKKFLDTIFQRSLLDSESRELLNQLRGVFDSVYELRTFLLEFNERVEVEVNHRRNLQPNTEEVKDAQRIFFANYVMQAKGKIETLYTTTQDLVRMFLLVLNRQQDLTLQCLSFRLDFNEYYHQKDSRLSQPLTFQHRRRSSNAFVPLNMSGSFTGMPGGSPLMASISIPEGDED